MGILHNLKVRFTYPVYRPDYILKSTRHLRNYVVYIRRQVSIPDILGASTEATRTQRHALILHTDPAPQMIMDTAKNNDVQLLQISETNPFLSNPKDSWT